MNEYIDVRGKHPVYIKGLIAFELTGYARHISVYVARGLYLETLNDIEYPVRYE